LNNRSTQTSSDSDTLAIGWIPYWNLLPLRHELIKSWRGNVRLEGGAPSVVNRLLSDGRVSLAPCSSICLLLSPSHELALPLGVASHGAVQSVYLAVPPGSEELLSYLQERQRAIRFIVSNAVASGSEDFRLLATTIEKAVRLLPGAPAHLLPAVQLTAASASSAMLARVLYWLWFGPAAFDALISSDQHSLRLSFSTTRRPLQLIIGDEALVQRSQFQTVLDLGEVWRDLTGLPFVFAVWQRSAGQSVPVGWRNRILEAAELAQARMKVEPSVYYPDAMPRNEAGREIDLASYWRGIDYQIGPVQMQGLLLYLSLVRTLLHPRVDDQVVVKMMRWQGMSQSAIG